MKDIYQALNDVDIDLSKYEDKTLSDIEVKKIKRRLDRRLKSKKKIVLKLSKKVTIIVGALTLALGVTYKANSTFATDLPLVGKMIKNIIGQGNEEYDKYTQVINKTIEKNGVRVTLNEFNIDSIGARVAATFDTDESLEGENVFTVNPRLYINGKWINCSGNGDKKVVDDHKYITVDILNISKADKEIPENMDVRLEYDEIRIGDKSVEGPWIFKFKASKKEVMSETKNYRIDKSLSLNDGSTVWLDDVIITPVAMSLKYIFNTKDLIRITSYIVGDNGQEIVSNGCHSGKHGESFGSGEVLFDAPKKDAKKLSFKLEVKDTGEIGAILGRYEFELELN